MEKLNYYQEKIVSVTGCKPEEAAAIEEIMREDILHSTLDWLTKGQFNKTAKEAYEVYVYMNSPEGKAYMAELERQCDNA